MRIVALLLTFAIAGPSVGALICDWTCAAAHQAAAAAETNCHDAPGPTQTATFAAGHACHELPASAACIVTCATSLDDVAATVDTAIHGRAIAQAPFASRRPDSHMGNVVTLQSTPGPHVTLSERIKAANG